MIAGLTAVTIGLLTAGKHAPGEVVPYVVAQVLGAIGGVIYRYVMEPAGPETVAVADAPAAP